MLRFVGYGFMKISHYIERTSVLGPYSRSALWVHGCCFSCEGCLAKEMNIGPYKECTPADLSEIFLKVADTEGITISGGEPFLQSEELAKMLDCIKAKRDYGVIIYTGFLKEELEKNDDAGVKRLLQHIDILIDGHYMQELDDGKPYRGSSNQKIHLMTDRYKSVFEDYYNGTDKRNIEIDVEKDNVYMVGVPSKNGIEVWRQFKKKADGNRDAI
ncbi:MAG: radical SAM protein [Oribacterium sp.]|nr:radical SAM protein [Oribacterium sp.]